MSTQQLQDFQRRTITAENMVKSLQQQIDALRQEMQNNNNNNQSAKPDYNDDSKQSGTFRPDETYPVWYTPYNQLQANQPDNIKVLNSLCPSEKVPFIPKNGRKIKWYTCGPTVYAPSHMGHARTYITFDIIRNILEYYFSYRVNLVMNITDVDDKIILRARQNYLFDQYSKENINDTTKIMTDIENAFKLSLEKRNNAVTEAMKKLETAVERHKKDMQENLDGQKVKKKNVQTDYKKYQIAVEDESIAKDKKNEILLKLAKSVISEWLDKEKGHTVKDQAIFRAHAEHFEKEFFEDMRGLNVRDPDVLTRVTEYVPEIIKFVQKLIDNGYGYVSNGSVYFSIENYLKTHDYPKLDPKKLDNQLLMDDAEGALASKDAGSEKRSPRDFALWKKSRDGEPQWKSPWGNGRPGWHIECSTMASQILGDNMDIHTGGEDLKFPHHDNEMAQSSAFYSKPGQNYYHQQWVNYWFHAGHLHIGGLKMSKSLKNFITIRQALEMCTTRQIRLLFLLQTWHGKMNYSDDSIEETQAKERQIQEFFLLINALNRKYNSEEKVSSTPYLPSNKDDADLNEKIMERQVDFDKALRDNFDYVTATQLLFDLIGDINTYIKNIGDNIPNILLLNKSASFVNDMLKIFGVISQSETYFLGAKQIEAEKYLQPVLDVITLYRADLTGLFRNKCEWKEYGDIVTKYQERIDELRGDEDEKKNGGVGGNDVGLRKKNLIQALVTFNDGIKGLTSNLEKNSSKDLIKMTDELRDNILPKYGIKIEDVEGGKGSIWKLYEPEVLLKLLSTTGKNAKDIKKLQNKIKQYQKDIENWNKKAIKPSEYFKSLKDKNGNLMYSQFDENGVPTHDANNKEIAKKQKKKVTKLMQKQEKDYKAYQKKIKENPNFLQEMIDGMKQAQSQL